MTKQQWKMESKIGPLYLIASDRALRGVFWDAQDVPFAESLRGGAPATKILAETVRQLDEYLVGKRDAFELPLEAEGTPFQRRVWDELSKIPYGVTCSYRDLAKRIRHHKAVRAVGSANGRNPLSIIVPCHRVIAADGTLGGYAGGLSTKRKLLDLESVRRR